MDARFGRALNVTITSYVPLGRSFSRNTAISSGAPGVSNDTRYSPLYVNSGRSVLCCHPLLALKREGGSELSKKTSLSTTHSST